MPSGHVPEQVAVKPVAGGFAGFRKHPPSPGLRWTGPFGVPDQSGRHGSAYRPASDTAARSRTPPSPRTRSGLCKGIEGCTEGGTPVSSRLQEQGAIARKGRDMWAVRCRWGMTAGVVLALAAGPSRAQGSTGPRPATAPAAEALRIVFFHSLTCNECRKVKRMLDGILRPWGGRVRVEWKSTGDIQVFRELLLYDEHCGYGVRTKSPPVMFVGRRHLEGEKRRGKGVRNLFWTGRRFSLAFCPGLDRVMPCPGHPGPRQAESSRTS